MVANIESFVGGRGKPAWHNLGTVVDGLMTKSEVLAAASLNDWDVQTEPLRIDLGGDESVEMPNKFVTTRMHEGVRKPIAVVGGRYLPTQNEDAFAMADAIVDAGDAAWDTAGSLGSGERVFGSLLLPKSVVVDGQGIADTVDTYVMMATSHDGTMPVTAAVTPVRVVCKNTLTIALAGAKNKYKVRHTASSEFNLLNARETLKIAYAYMDRFEDEVTALFESAMTANQFDSLIAASFGECPTENINSDGDTKNLGAISRWGNRRDELHDVLGGDTNKGINGTFWGGFNAIEEYMDYHRPYRGDIQNLWLPHLGFDDAMNSKKSSLFKAAKSLATV
jgi:phage/plasmid-like protein (TIGR03299 family)